MLHLRGFMFGREGLRVCDTEEDSGFFLEDGAPERNFNELNEKGSVVVGDSEVLLKLEIGRLRPNIALTPTKQENSKLSKATQSLKGISLLSNEKSSRWTTDKTSKKDFPEDNFEQSVSPDTPSEGHPPDLSPLTSDLRTNIKTRFSSSLPPFFINATKLSTQTVSKQPTLPEINLSHSESHSLLSRQNLERNTSLTNTSYRQLSRPARQNLQPPVSKYQRVSSVTHLPPLREHTGNFRLSQEGDTEELLVRTIGNRPNKPTFNQRKHNQSLFVKKTRPSLDERINRPVTQSGDLAPFSTTDEIFQYNGDFVPLPGTPSSVQKRGSLADLLIPARVRLEIVRSKSRSSIKSLPYHNEYHPPSKAKSQRFLGRYRTPSTPVFLNCPAQIRLSYLRTRSLSLPSLRHQALERKGPLFIAIANRNLLVPTGRLESAILVTYQSRLHPKNSRRLPVLTPTSIFKVKMPPHATQEACGSATPSPTPLTNGIVPTPPESVATAASRRGGSNNATNGSLHGGPRGADAPPNSPISGVAERETVSMAEAVARGLSQSMQSHPLIDAVRGSNYYDDGNYYHDGPAYQRRHDAVYDYHRYHQAQHDRQASYYENYAYQQAIIDQYPGDPAGYYIDNFPVQPVEYHYGDGNPSFAANGPPSTPVQARSRDSSLSSPRTPSRGGDSDDGQIQSQSLTEVIQDGALRRATLQTTPTHRPIRRASRTAQGSQYIGTETAPLAGSNHGVDRAPTFFDLGVEHVEEEVPGPGRLSRFTDFARSCVCARPRKYQTQ